VSLTDEGRKQASLLGPALKKFTFSAVFTSPLSRAKESAELAGLGNEAVVLQDLGELDYGEYEGMTTAQIRETVPNWSVWTHPCLGGESLEQAQVRTSRVIAQAKAISGDVAIFSHGHILRILTATWLSLPAEAGRYFMLGTGTMSILGHERENPAIQCWNAPVATF